MNSSYSIEGHDGVISGEGMTYQMACRAAQREADRTGQTWYVVDEDGYREAVEPCGGAPAFVCRASLKMDWGLDDAVDWDSLEIKRHLEAV